MDDNIALIIVFNHRYDVNIKILEDIYKDRFTNIYYLVPFYNGDNVNVIPVYGNSYYYSLYIAQAFRSFFKDEYSHYFFIADDMVLNPSINEDNLLRHLKISDNESFIPEIRSMHEVYDRWHTRDAAHFNRRRWGVEAFDQIPSYEEAVIAFSKHNLQLKALTKDQIYEPETLMEKLIRFLMIRTGKEKKRKPMYDLQYPIVGAFSDIMLVSKDAIKKFSHYCGVFGALELFVELAIPTALILSADKIISEKNLRFQGKYLWTDDELKELEKYDNNLNNLLKNFPPGYLFLHPVKLSKWKTT